MKNLLKLVVFCVVVFLVAEYLDSHHIYPVKQKIAEAGNWIKNQYNEIKSSAKSNSENSGGETVRFSVGG